MKCPKCHHDMVEVREEHVYIDVCKTCRGVFLDAGELAELVRGRDHHPHHGKDRYHEFDHYDAPHYKEERHHHSDYKHGEHKHSHHSYDEKYGHKYEKHGYHKPHKKKSKMHKVLGELFDF